MLVGASATAQTNFNLLKSFNGSDGAVPFGTLMQGSDGALYGTTVTGGSSNSGTVFMLNKDGSGYVVLKSFSGADGRGPYAGLAEGANGALYGTTYAGGTADSGIVFKLNKD